MNKRQKQNAAIERRREALDKAVKVWGSEVQVCLADASRSGVHCAHHSFASNISRGVGTIRLLPRTEITGYFQFPDRSLEDSLRADWCKIGHDFYRALIHRADELS